MSISPATSSSSSWGFPWVFPGQMGYVIPPPSSSSDPRFSSSRMCLEYLHKDVSRRPPQRERAAVFLCASLQMFKLLARSLRLRELLSAACIHDLILTLTTQSS